MVLPLPALHPLKISSKKKDEQYDCDYSHDDDDAMKFLVSEGSQSRSRGSALFLIFGAEIYKNSSTDDTPLYVHPEGNACDVFINLDSFIVYSARFLNKKKGEHF